MDMLKKISIFLLAALALAASFVFLNNRKAAADYEMNVHGFAWSSEIGWISFNYEDCEVSGGVYTGNPGGCPPNGTTVHPYGVYVNTEGDTGFADHGDISGFAYSSNVGWISFNATSYCDGGINAGRACGDSGDCGGNPCVADSGVMGANPEGTTEPPHYDSGTGLVTGWAKIISQGNNGWIKLDARPYYGLEYDATSQEFNGWAWNGYGACDDNGQLCGEYTSCETGNCILQGGIGWISFNNEDISVCDGGDNAGYVCPNAGCSAGGGTCVPGSDFSSYFVRGDLNTPPRSDIAMSAPNWGRADVCGTENKDSLRAELRWQFSDSDYGDTLSAYRVIVEESNGGPTVLDTGKCTAQSGACLIDISAGIGNGDSLTYVLDGEAADSDLDNNGFDDIAYCNSYRWGVEMWDSGDESTGEIWSDANPSYILTTCEGFDDSDGLSGDEYDCNYHRNETGEPPYGSFTTFCRRFPNPDDFIWVTPNPAEQEDVLFISRNRALYGNSMSGCEDTDCRWLWSTDGGGAVQITDDTASSTIVVFSDRDNIQNDITLEIFDIDSQLPGQGEDSQYSCSSSTDLVVKQKLPVWIEAR